MSSTLRALTYNIHSCIGADRRQDPERVMKILHTVDADIVALQEVRGYSAENNQFQFLCHRLGHMEGVFGGTYRATRYAFGNALFVRGEILATRQLDLTVRPFDARGGIDCTVAIGGSRLRVITAHLGLFPRERQQQIGMIDHALQAHVEETTVILGDFNIFGAERRRLHRIGAPKLLPRVRTFPAPRPIMSLDRVWTIPNERMITLEAFRDPPARWASDHLPLVGEFSVLPTQPIRETVGVRRVSGESSA